MLILNLFYFLISRPKNSMERDKGGFLNKASDWKTLLLHLKFEQNPDCPNKKYNAIFEYIHQNIRTYCRNKKYLHWSMNGKVLLHIGKNQRKERIASMDKCGLFQMQLRGLGGNAITGKNFIFSLHVRLDTVFPALKLTQNLCINAI